MSLNLQQCRLESAIGTLRKAATDYAETDVTKSTALFLMLDDLIKLRDSYTVAYLSARTTKHPINNPLHPRYNPYIEYERFKAEWVREHPNHTDQQYDAMIREITERLDI